MKKLTNFERKHLLLGLLLMCGSIIFYVICTKDIESTDVFKIFFPIFWGLYTIVSIAYILLSGWLTAKSQTTEDSQEEIEKEISKRRFLLVSNILTAITLVLGYISSTFKNVSVQYSTYQPLGWTLAICIEIAMYVIYLFKEEKLQPVVMPKENKVQGVQLITYEEAIKILEEYGYEIEGVSDSKDEEKNTLVTQVSIQKDKGDNDVERSALENKTTLPATTQSKKSRVKRQKEYKKREDN